MKKQIIFILILSLITFNVILLCNNTQNSIGSHDQGGYAIAITNGILIDGTGDESIPDAIIIIQDKYIHAVGTATSLTLPNGIDTININGSFILPGFMNTHIHGGYLESNLKEWMKSGITSVRDLGNFENSPEQAFSIRDKLLNNYRNARLIAAGPIVTTIGGYGNYSVNSPADAEKKINGLIDAGADLIKIAIEDNLQGRTWPMLSEDEIKTIVETAHNRNKRVSAHITRAKHLDMAIKAGVDDVNHMIINDLPDSLITQMIEKDIYWVPTLELWNGVSEYHSLNWNIIARNNLRLFVQAGGKVALGTDYNGYITHFELGMPLVEMNLMQEAGMTPMQIIIAGTKHAAHVCDLENELGTIEPNKIADLIIVNGNPLEDLNVLSNIKMVIHNGEIIINNIKAS